MTQERYREDQYGAVYEYNEHQKAYVFIGKKIGNETFDELIERLSEEENELY